MKRKSRTNPADYVALSGRKTKSRKKTEEYLEEGEWKEKETVAHGEDADIIQGSAEKAIDEGGEDGSAEEDNDDMEIEGNEPENIVPKMSSNKSKHWSTEEYDTLLEAESAIYRGYRVVGENCYDPKCPTKDSTECAKERNVKEKVWKKS